MLSSGRNDQVWKFAYGHKIIERKSQLGFFMELVWVSFEWREFISRVPEQPASRLHYNSNLFCQLTICLSTVTVLSFTLN